MTTPSTTTSTIAPSPESPPAEDVPRPRRWSLPFPRTRVLAGLEHLVLAGIAYIPLLVVRPGVETSDTKTYLYLDPGRFLRQVTSMWDPTVGLGTVTHQYIGYLLPMGPFYWFFHEIGVPVWVAQRLWLGSLLFGAGAGVLYLSKTLNVGTPARLAAALAFMLTPYFLQYAGRISVILLPWAGLPFLVAFTARALREGGWRYPALFALVVAVTSGINATAIIYVGVAPLLWLVFAVFVHREAKLREALFVAARVTLLTILCCLWWIAGLIVEAGYGVDILRYTETLSATTSTSSPSEVIRGLGYWYFYGQDRAGPWTSSYLLYTNHLWLVAESYVVPTLAFVGGVIARWRYRAYFAVLALVGVVLSVGGYPFSHPTAIGAILKRFMTDTTAGFALRSTDRATPLMILGLAMVLGAGLSALWRRIPRTTVLFVLIVVAAVIADNPALFNGDAEVAGLFTQPAKLPSYELQAVKHLNATHPGTRVLAIPGSQFASYRWADFVDPPEPGFLNRPFVTREELVMGSIATADFLAALDDPIQLDTEQWQTLAPLARLLSAGDILVQYDQRYEQYNGPEPKQLAQQLAQTPAGLSDPVTFGKPTANKAAYSYVDNENLVTLTPLPNPSPLETYTVDDPRPITRAEADTGAIIVAGDAVGLYDMAAAGLLNTSSAIYYSSTLDENPTLLETLLRSGAALVLTDTNRKQAFRWDTFAADYGYTETPADHPQTTDPSDSPIELTPGAPLSSETTATYLGAVDVTASTYGNADSYTPEDDAYSAIDNNLDTAWTTGIGVSDPAGQWWQVKTGKPITADQVTLVQPQNGDVSRRVTKVTLTFDGKRPVTVALGPASDLPAGQKITFSTRSFSSLRVRIDATTNDSAPAAAASSIGFAEVEVPNLSVFEVVKLPTDLLKAAGTASIDNRLTISLSRERVSPLTFPYRSDPETTIAREFTLPTARTFSLTGTASLSSLIPDDEIDTLVGRENPATSPVIAYSKGRLPGDLEATASAAADGNLSTAWQPGFGATYEAGQWLEYDLKQPITFDHMDLQVVADGRHSVPTEITVSTEQGSRTVVLPKIKDRHVDGATVSVPVSFPALTGTHIRVTFTKVRFELGTNFYSAFPVALPLGIAEVGIPGVEVAPAPPDLPSVCRSNLISVDGRPISVEVVGSTATALSGGEVDLVPCGPDAGGITLGPGPHTILTALGHSTATGWNVDQLTLDSAPGGGASAPATFGTLPATQPGAAPTVRVLGQTDTSEQLKVTGATGSFELVFGESANHGWQATAAPVVDNGRTPHGSRSVSLGPSVLVDGFANGWQVSTTDLKALGATRSGSFTVSLTWRPQRYVWSALIVSLLSLIVCLGLALVPLRRHLRRRSRATALAAPATEGVGVSRQLDDDETPTLRAPWRGEGQRPHVWAIAVIAAVIGVAGGVISEPRVGLAAALVALAALSVRWFRGLLSLSAVGFIVAAVVVIVVDQHDVGFNVDRAGWLVWAALIALAADALVGTARSWRQPGDRAPTALVAFDAVTASGVATDGGAPAESVLEERENGERPAGPTANADLGDAPALGEASPEDRTEGRETPAAATDGGPEAAEEIGSGNENGAPPGVTED